MKTFLSIGVAFLFHNFILAQNTNLGTGAGNSGSENTSVGAYAGDKITGISNVYLGYQSGSLMTSCSFNTFLGSKSGYSSTISSNNLFSGFKAGYNNVSGSENVFLGSMAGELNVDGQKNVYLGFWTGSSLGSASNNVMIGYYSGLGSIGNGNVFLGYEAGKNVNSSNKLYIDNSSASIPLIFGDFSLNQVGINVKPVSTHTLSVGGTIHATGVTVAGSVNATGIYVNGVQIGGNISNWVQSGSSIYNLGTNVGIGTTTPSQKLDVNGVINASGIYINGVPFAGGGSQWSTIASTSTIYYNGGNVGIGTTNPGNFKLAVDGKIGAREIIITLANPWPDYVFEQEYSLPSLSELEDFIRVNKHLPGVPSASEVKENGLSVGEMNAILLGKVEELTLYIIQLKKDIEALKEANVQR